MSAAARLAPAISTPSYTKKKQINNKKDMYDGVSQVPCVLVTNRWLLTTILGETRTRESEKGDIGRRGMWRTCQYQFIRANVSVFFGGREIPSSLTDRRKENRKTLDCPSYSSPASIFCVANSANIVESSDCISTMFYIMAVYTSGYVDIIFCKTFLYKSNAIACRNPLRLKAFSFHKI